MVTIDYIVVAIYFALILFVGLYSSRKKDDSSQYFLANRNLGWFIVGASLFASNIGSEHLIGLAESGFKRGLIESQFEILAAFMLLLLGWVFVPFYNKSGVITMPEFLEKRFSSSARMYLSVLSIFAYVITKISVTIFAGAIVFESLLGINFWLGAVIVVLVTGLYTVFGGLKAVVYTDAIQLFIIIGGSLMLTVFGLQEIGGWQQMVDTSRDGAMSLWRSANDTDYPWTAILFGAPILGVWYWCTDQFIVQRALAARNISTARKATIFAGFLKLTPMFLFVVPGMIAYTYSQTNLEFANQIGDGAAALPVMVQAMLPAGLRGLVAAGILSALMSSLSSVFNSCSTLITVDIYKKYKPNTSEKKLVRVGQIATLFLVAIGILWIPFQESLSAGGLFKYIQGIQAYVAPPIAAAFLLGLFIKRLNSQGVMTAFYTGAVLGVLRLVLEVYGIQNFITNIHFLHFALNLFILCSVIMIIVSYLTKKPDYEKIKDLVYSKSALQTEEIKKGIETIDSLKLLVDQRISQAFDKVLTVLLIIFVFVIWYVFR